MGYAKGVQVLARLLNDELDRVFTEYSSISLSERLPAHWTRRSRMVTGDEDAYFSIPKMTCSNCEETFDPNSNWRYCPNCGTGHDFLEQASDSRYRPP
jgi:hypothetical protein